MECCCSVSVHYVHRLAYELWLDAMAKLLVANPIWVNVFDFLLGKNKRNRNVVRDCDREFTFHSSIGSESSSYLSFYGNSFLKVFIVGISSIVSIAAHPLSFYRTKSFHPVMIRTKERCLSNSESMAHCNRVPYALSFVWIGDRQRDSIFPAERERGWAIECNVYV